MILSREQINRYLRHIIIPEISGPGQKKIIEAGIFVFADNVKSSEALLYYLAASGVGSISCCFIDSNGYEKLFCGVRDLNNECTIELFDINILNEESISSKKAFSTSLFLTEMDKINTIVRYTGIEFLSKLPSIILGIYDGWRGSIQLLHNSEELLNMNLSINDLNNHKEKDEGSILSKGLLGAVGAIEAIKTILGIGLKCEKPLCFDLLSMEFNRHSSDSIPGFFSNGLSQGENGTKYFIPKALKDCKVLIVGTGGLGSPAALALSGAGVGTIGLMDYDSVEVSNLNRQILHSTSRIGIPKVESAREFIKNSFNEVNVITYNVGLSRDNVMDILREYDVVIDAVDNFPTRYLLNDACYFAGKPMIEAGAVRFSGLNMTILPGVGTCYRCLFPDIPEAGSIQGCAEVGVLGPVPGVMGFIQAAETVKLLRGMGELLVNRIMYFDALDLDFDVINIDKNLKCRLCGNTPNIIELQEYDFKCESEK